VVQACKIGSTNWIPAWTVTLLACCWTAEPAIASPQDSAAVRREMRRAATDYERALRRAAPYRASSYSGQCDEIVGRFCLTYDSGSRDSLPPEPEPIKKARARAIEAFQAAFKVWPADTLVAGPLVRFLIEHDQLAIDVAADFGAASGDHVWRNLLTAFALHAAGDYERAGPAFLTALSHMRPSDRERWEDVRVLLDQDEQPRYRALGDSAKREYQQRLWRLADPLYLTAGNESHTEHFARQVYARILARAPMVNGSSSWGWDLDELTVRFGVPKLRTQDFARSSMSMEPQITEHYDPAQQTFVPPTMITKPGITEFAPVAEWPYDTIRSRNGYAPRSVRKMLPLDHVLSRFREGDSLVVRVDAQLVFDSAVTRPARVEVGLFLLDSIYQLQSLAIDTIEVTQDTARANLSVRLPDKAVAYSIEMRELGSRLAGRARHLLPPALPLARPLLSDVVLLHAGESLPSGRNVEHFPARTSLRLKRGESAAIYLEVTGLTPDNDRMVKYTVDLEVMEEARPGVFTRAVKRLGRALGMAGESVSPRVTWNEQKPAAVAIPIALNLGRLQLDTGLKRFRVTVTDRETGVRSSIDRIVRIESR
jgi:hypothetical protein